MRIDRRALALAACIGAHGCSGEAVVGVVDAPVVDGGVCVKVPAPVGSIDPDLCEKTTSCSVRCYDEAGHVYGVACGDTTCQCSYDEAFVCACAVEGASICGGLADPCCPPPWLGY